jgi:preprotein translocase subunit SecE
MTKKVKKTEREAPSMFQRIKDYFVELKYEWQKVTFPTRKELVQSTTVVFLFTVLLMTVMSLYDLAITFLFDKWILPPTG